MVEKGGVVEDDAVVSDDREALLVGKIEHFADKIAATERLVDRAEARGIKRRADVGVAVEHDGAAAPLGHRVDVGAGIEPGEKALVPVGDMHVHQQAAEMPSAPILRRSVACKRGAVLGGGHGQG